MKYAILSVDDSRKNNKERIRNLLSEWGEVIVVCVNGKDNTQLRQAVEKWEVPLPGPFKRGEFGIFFSLLQALDKVRTEGEGVVVFEDDAQIRDDFAVRCELYLQNMPEDMDFCSLWVPDGQKRDYYYDVTYDSGGVPSWSGELSYKRSHYYVGHPYLSKVYQGFSLVATYFTSTGAQKIISYAKEMGMFTPADCMIYIGAHTGKLNGYALNPKAEPLVDYDWNQPTTIHHTQWGSIEELLQ